MIVASVGYTITPLVPNCPPVSSDALVITLAVSLYALTVALINAYVLWSLPQVLQTEQHRKDSGKYTATAVAFGVIAGLMIGRLGVTDKHPWVTCFAGFVACISGIDTWWKSVISHADSESFDISPD